jgi:hypothetical protein
MFFIHLFTPLKKSSPERSLALDEQVETSSKPEKMRIMTII